MFDRFFPDQYVASTYVIDFEKLYEEGVRGLIFDIDNTDYVIRVVLINRKTGMHIFTEDRHKFIIGKIDIYKGHVDSGNHDIFCS